jgi:GNAT superfamily N-acetyltransferase
MELTQIDQLTERQVNDLLALYNQEWWCLGRRLEDVRRMLDGTGVTIGFADPDGRLVAFARVLTDGVYKALIFDVIVAADYRDTGLGRRLMDTLVDHPRLRGVAHLELYCLPELEPFYRRWGFTSELGKLRFMRRLPP